MSWNGSGTFSRIHNWVVDKANTIGIVATRHDAEDDSFAAGIQACITKNNESKPTANFAPDADDTYSLGTAGARWKGAHLSDTMFQAKGADKASATTVNLQTATGNLVHVTGTTTTTGFTMTSGQQMLLIADAAWPLTYDATDMKINGGVSYTCAAGDRLHVYYDGTTTFVDVIKVDGKAVIGTSVVTATYDLTTASGSQAITGAGFPPSSIDIIAGVTTTVAASQGMATSGDEYNIGNSSAPDIIFSSNTALRIQTGAGDTQVSVVNSFDADGVTLGWAKTGTPSGTLEIMIRFYP